MALITKKIKGTDYRLSLIPLGGYCGMKGEKDFQYAIENSIKIAQLTQLTYAHPTFAEAILDSVLVGTPILVDFNASPIEKASANLFTKRLNCGIYEKNPKKIRELVQSFIENPNLLNPYIEAISKFNEHTSS